MQISDPISDLLTRIRNAQKAGHDVVSVPASKVKVAIVMLLQREGFVKAYKCIRDNKQGIIKIALKYNDEQSNEPNIKGLIRESKPGRRKYLSASELRQYRNGFGLGILSTSSGIMTAKEAKMRGIGGEYLCAVY